jgi:putative SOS response-associated peptidase YedK
MSKKTARNPDSTPADFTPLEQVLVVRENPETHERESVTMRWGLVPSGAESPTVGSRLTHARGETVGTKPVFREAFRHRRCLIVVDSFEIGKRKAIQVKDGRPFGVGGVWERWQNGDEVIESCAIITTESNELVRSINDRMPVIIAPEDYNRWLDPEFFDAEELQRMMQAYRSEEMVLVPSKP